MHCCLMRMIRPLVHQQIKYLNQISKIMQQFYIFTYYRKEKKITTNIDNIKYPNTSSNQQQIIHKNNYNKNKQMSLYMHDDSSYARTEELELSSKIDEKKEDECDDQIAMLCEKINQMEKNYIAMQKHYSDKIKQLHLQIKEKDQQFAKLKQEMIEIKTIALDHRKKVDELNKNNIQKQTQQPRVKSKSPVLTTRSNKGIINNVETDQTKSISPKNSTKKSSPEQKPPIYKRNVLTKASLGSTQSGNLNKNISSSQKNMKKSVSPKNSYEKTKKITPKVDQVQSLKMVKKPSGVMSSFRQKAPVFKFK